MIVHPPAERLSAMIDGFAEMAAAAIDLSALAEVVAKNISQLDGATGAAVSITVDTSNRIWTVRGYPAPASAADLQSAEIRSMIAVPLPAAGAAVGGLWVYSSNAGAFGAEDFAIVERFANIAGAILNLSLHFNRKLYESHTDELTGLQNRRAYDERLMREMGEYRRYGKPFALVIIDVDGFKSINDRYGHVRGDLTLASVAKVMRKELRAADEVFRIGGDEFAILMPHVNAGVAEVLMSRLSACINGTEGLSVSYGIAQPAPSDAETTLRERADRALNEHKRRRA